MKQIPFEFGIALRYLKTKRHGFFALVTTLVAIGGVTLGVGTLIVTLAIMTGFRADIQDKTLGIQPHIVVFGTEKDSEIDLESLVDKIKSVQQVESAAPFILGQTLVKSSHGSQGIVVRGIDPEKEFSVTDVKSSMISGNWGVLNIQEPSKGFIVLGKELARNLSVSLGDELLVFSPTESAAVGAMGSVPKIQKFSVGGIFQAGFYDFDSNMAFISLSHAQQLFDVPAANGIGVRTKNLDRADEVAAKIGETVGARYWARSWLSMNRNLFQALKLEKIMMTLVLTMIILVASFTIISNLILMSIEKSKDIGILRALGASQNSIKKIFLYAGMILGTTGTILGATLGIAIVETLKKTQWIKLPQDVYYISTLPLKLTGFDLSLILICAFAITVVSAIYPAVQASKMNPVEAIRYG